VHPKKRHVDGVDVRWEEKKQLELMYESPTRVVVGLVDSVMARNSIDGTMLVSENHAQHAIAFCAFRYNMRSPDDAMLVG
jgi:hypothetical protein